MEDNNIGKRNSDLIGALLSSISSGVLTVSVNDLPLAKVDAGSRTVDVEASGIKEAGIKLREMAELGAAGGGARIGETVRSTTSIARELYEMNWSLRFYDRGKKLLTMGQGASRLTGHISVNPLKIHKILEAI